MTRLAAIRKLRKTGSIFASFLGNELFDDKEHNFTCTIEYHKGNIFAIFISNGMYVYSVRNVTGRQVLGFIRRNFNRNRAKDLPIYKCAS